MMQSESFTRFVEAVTGLKLDYDLSLQVICYEQGDYSGPHNDHHPEEETIREGYIDFHVMFPNEAVAHQYLVYEEKRHFSRIVDVNVPGGVSIYKLPFWHYTTPLAGKPGREPEARSGRCFLGFDSVEISKTRNAAEDRKQITARATFENAFEDFVSLGARGFDETNLP